MPVTRETVGAKVIANNEVSDFALFELTEHPAKKSGVTPYYLGWDRSGSSGIGGVGIHHPSGDIKKISIYVVTPLSTDYLSNSVNTNKSHWRVTWSQGTTEGGSSGSSLLNSNHRIIGQLHGGYASCNAQTQPDWYGKFSVSWTGDNASDSRRRLKDWLDPLNTDVTYLNGKNCHVVLNNKSYNSGTYSIAGCTVEIFNTTIEPNTTVRVHGQQSVVLKSGFHAKAESDVRITAGEGIAKLSIDDEDTTFMLKSLELAAETTEIINADFIIYPNPNDGNFTIKIAGEINPYTVEIFNSLGGLLGYVNCNDGIVNINRTDLNTGIYYVKVTMNEKTVVKKIIIQ